MITTKLRFVEGTHQETLAEQKSRLREYMKNRRSENENRDVKETLLLENFYAFLSANAIRTKRKFSIYLSFSMEAPTDRLIETLVQAGHEVYCPRIEDEEMTMVKYGQDFSLSHMGIREPLGERYDGELDYVVLPLLAVDKDGNRLGYGKGYYDRFLKERSKAICIAYCYDFQVLKNVPSETHDERVDVIVTDKRILQTKSKK